MAIAPNAEPVGASEDAASVEEARIILQHFYKLQPNLTGLARSITGREDVSVRPSASGTYTDNKDIYLMLNPSMKMDEPHARNQCGARDRAGLMKCEACKRYEHVIVSLYHEMGHIIFDSFASADDKRMREFLHEQMFTDNALDLPEKYLDKVIEKFAKNPPKSYLEYANYINPFFPMLLNALEDSRVNAGIIGRNPGALKMFRADVVNVISGGIIDVHGNKTMWSDQPLNAQFTIGCLLVASLIPIETGWLDDDVTAALRDLKLNHLLETVATSDDAAETFERSLMVLKRGRELGYYLLDDDTDDGPGEGDGDEGDEGEQSDTDDGDTQSSGMSGMTEGDDDFTEENDGDADGESGSESDDDGDDGDDAGNGSGDDDDESDDGGDDEDGEGTGDGDDDEQDEGCDGTRDSSSEDEGDDDDTSGSRGRNDRRAFGDPEDVAELLEAFNPHENESHDDGAEDGDHDAHSSTGTEDNPMMERALRQEDWDSTSETLFGLDVRQPDDPGFAVIQDYEPDPAVVADPSIVQRSLGPLRVAFSENSRGSYDRNRRSGRVDARVLARRIPNNDARLFRKKHEPGKRDYHVVLGFDVSGSTYAGTGHGMSYIQMIKTCVLLQSEMLSRIGVPFEIYAHTGGVRQGATSQRGDWHGSFTGGYGDGLALNIFKLKGLDESYTDRVRDRIKKTMYSAYNLDGHTLEFYRKRLDETNASDKLIVYYTDGAMPNENYDEELALLKRECATIKQRSYDVLAVGIANSDPQRFGLDTVRVDVPDDMHKVVLELQRRLR